MYKKTIVSGDQQWRDSIMANSLQSVSSDIFEKLGEAQ